MIILGIIEDSNYFFQSEAFKGKFGDTLQEKEIERKRWRERDGEKVERSRTRLRERERG